MQSSPFLGVAKHICSYSEISQILQEFILLLEFLHKLW